MAGHGGDSGEHPSAAQAPIVIAHRGASGYLPEHTLAGYALAIQQGADFIEPDLVMTADGVLIARHDNVLDLTTDVASKPEFAARRVRRSVDGSELEGWFSEDFTLAEIKSLRAVERIPEVRPANARFDGQFQIPTLPEILELVRAYEGLQGRRIGIYPETKQPTHFERCGLAMEAPLLRILAEYGYREAADPVFIQSFEVGNLRHLRQRTRLRLIQLLDGAGGPFDAADAGDSLRYEQMGTAQGLREIARYADGVGPEKYHFIVPRDAAGNLDRSRATSFVGDAHAVGLAVHPYTFRAENRFLPLDLRSSAEPNAAGYAAEELRIFLEAGIDGLFIDQPDLGVRARDAFLAGR